MPLDDVWKKANTQLGFYTLSTFNNVPSTPGVYAWFFPLRINTKSFDEFMEQINFVMNYDSVNLGKPSRENTIKFNWDKIKIKTEIELINNIPNIHLSTWNEICNSDKFEEFRKLILKTSIYLPPLYVGKTTNLKKRCEQHINGSFDSNDFNYRFENHVSKMHNIACRKVSDLIFACITTEELTEIDNDIEGLIEYILKSLSKPKFSKL